MSIVIKVAVTQQNNERNIAEIIKQNRGRRIENLYVEDKILLLEFSDNDNCTVKNAVKQYSKKKYPRWIDITTNINSSSRVLWWPTGLIDLPNSWLIFYERDF